ncbi:MAG: hypothetical protein D3921_07325 [Candidatus Electrothrix sp. AW1]|nr:hypothetical protein [Candidatus Electrothrix sp. AX1]MCI5182315.1 hypothetical protein [Candidatus Electrothrix gigas]
MGTDIELYAECLEKGRWCPVTEPAPNAKGKILPVEFGDVLGRTYEFFSVLAGESISSVCRNDVVPSVSPPRGFPDDMSKLYNDLLPLWYEEVSGFNTSWLMVRELVDFDWDTLKVLSYGYVEKEYAHLFNADQDFPAELPKDTKIYHGLYCPPPDTTVKVCWSIGLRCYTGNAVDWLLQDLLPLGLPDEVRIIYWFWA